MAALALSNIHFSYGTEPVLSGLDLHVADGERVLVAGASGSGKSTLMSLVCGIAEPQRGEVRVLGEDLAAMSPRARDRFRARRLGVVFQQFNLLPYLDVMANVLLPLRLSRTALEAAPDRARTLLVALGLSPDLAHRPVAQLSVGQQQRVAAARALLLEPGLVVADEPTSALDPARRDDFMSLLLAQAERTGAAVLCVSHDETLHPHFDRVVEL